MGTDLPTPRKAHPRTTLPSWKCAEGVRSPYDEITGSIFQEGSSDCDHDSLGSSYWNRCLDLWVVKLAIAWGLVCCSWVPAFEVLLFDASNHKPLHYNQSDTIDLSQHCYRRTESMLKPHWTSCIGCKAQRMRNEGPCMVDIPFVVEGSSIGISSFTQVRLSVHHKLLSPWHQEDGEVQSRET